MEAEAFLLGNWKNFEELETNISLPELEAILEAAREQEYQRNRFMAAMQGVDLDKSTKKDKEETAEERWHRVEMEAKAELAGKSSEEYELQDDQGFFAFESEEE